MAMFTDIDEGDRAVIDAAYALGPITSLTPIIDGMSETMFRLRAMDENYIVTIFETHVTEEELDRAFAAMEMLKAAEIPCPRPVRTLRGRSSIFLKKKRAAVVSFVEGHGAGYSTEGRCWELGRQAARIHVALAASSGNTAESGLPGGLVHGALTRDNLFFVGDRLTGIINFRSIRNGLPVEELARLAIDWTADAGAVRLEWMTAMLKGYESIKPLTNLEHHWLSGMIGRAVAGTVAAS